MGGKPKGDSAFRARLLAYLANYGFEVKKINKIRNNVFMIHTRRRTYFFKGFSSLKKYQTQKALTKLLRQYGFYKTYKFLFDIQPFEHEGYYYGFIEYLKPHREEFRFNTRKNRAEGLRLLGELHRATGNIVKDRRFYYAIPRYNQTAKWKQRLEEFESISHIVANYVPEQVIKQAIMWGHWALRGVKEHESHLYKEPAVITHGDVAYHNFLRVHSGEVYLIDWDLISKAPPIIDYLQFANRILPSIKYSYKELWSYTAFRNLKNNPAFVYGLGFPSDIFREWNRLVRENLLGSQAHVHSVWKLTVEGFEKRILFQEHLKERIAKLPQQR
ncbi:thiamine kinase-like enzyme [Peribacillus deserti]|uniref:Thiamine kinase-like enzyme n=1 Tax=Peribacillus deserti TaxID=673318 RepID=A0ABS2QHY5_9BACI|nr:phosphotransferase [Peribacillus deserti]MBM7691901.1 thiamine kinase-like enzyme [Peribacillus deserti]